MIKRMSSDNWDQDLQHLGMLHNLEMAAEREKKAIRLVESGMRKLREAIVNFYNHGVPISVIAESYKMTVEEVQAILNADGCTDYKKCDVCTKELL